jgi:hypothetical protein
MAFTPEMMTYRKLAFLWGVLPAAGAVCEYPGRDDPVRGFMSHAEIRFRAGTAGCPGVWFPGGRDAPPEHGIVAYRRGIKSRLQRGLFSGHFYYYLRTRNHQPNPDQHAADDKERRDFFIEKDGPQDGSNDRLGKERERSDAGIQDGKGAIPQVHRQRGRNECR